MSGFVEGIDRSQSSLFPAELEDYVAEDNLVRAVDAFVDGRPMRYLSCARLNILNDKQIISSGSIRSADCAPSPKVRNVANCSPMAIRPGRGPGETALCLLCSSD